MFFHRFFGSLRRTPGLWLFLFAFTAQLCVLMRLSASPHFLPGSDDMKFYNDWGLRIARGQLTDGQAFYGLPGYAYWLAGVQLVAGRFGLFFTVVAVGVLQAAAFAGVAVLIYRLSVTAFAPRAEQPADRLTNARPYLIGTAAAAAWIAFTPAQTFSAILMPTIWLVLAYYSCVLIALKTRSSSWRHPWLLSGVFCGLVATFVATVLFALPLLIVSIFRNVGRGDASLLRSAKAGAAVILLIAGVFVGSSPAWIHNRFIAHEPVMLSAHSGINFWIGNNPTATGYPKMPPGIRATQEGLLRDSITLAEEAVGRKMKRYEVSQFWSERANSYIRENPGAWLRLMGVKLANFWNAYQYDDLSIIKLLRDEGVLAPGLSFGFVAALGLAGLVPVVVRFPQARWIAAAVLLHMAAVLTVFVTERYRLAAVPGLMILGAAGLWELWAALLRKAWGSASIYLLCLGVAVWFVSNPRSNLSLWSLDHYKAGIRATERGDLDRAQRNLETAFAYVQDNADINFALGNLWLAKSERVADPREKENVRTRAKLFYRRALDLNPQHAGTLNNLGVLALEEKRYELAEKFFAASLLTEPDSAKTHYLLARARFESGKLAEAQTALDEALRLRPAQKEFLDLREKLKQPADNRLAPPASPQNRAR
jgi:tetratricopeptide (TPR) repeat protein